MRTLPHHFQSMERAAAWYPPRATPTFSRFHSHASMTEVSEPVSTLHPTCEPRDRDRDRDRDRHQTQARTQTPDADADTEEKHT